MRKINVLHVVEDLNVGGLERVVATIALLLNKQNYNVSVCCLARGGAIAEDLKRKGMDVEILDLGYHFSLLFVLKLALIMRKKKMDIVHTHAYVGSTIGRVSAILARVPVIISHKHTTMDGYNKRHLVIERLLSYFTNRIISCSNTVAESLVKRCHINPKKGVVIYNGVQESDFLQAVDPREEKKKLGIDPDSPVVGCVASLNYHKGHRYILEAMKIVIGANAWVNNPKIIFIGDGPLLNDLRDYSISLGINDEVIFTGIRQDIPQILSTMDIVVLASCVREGLGLSLIEAMAAGKPAIGTNLGGIPEVIEEGKTGLLVPPLNSAALARAIKILLLEKNKAELMGKAAVKAFNERFTAKIMLEKIERLYSELLTKENRGVFGNC